MLRIACLKILYQKNITLWAFFEQNRPKTHTTAVCNFSDIGPCIYYNNRVYEWRLRLFILQDEASIDINQNRRMYVQNDNNCYNYSNNYVFPFSHILFLCCGPK